jgi:hypothetical protein
MANKYASDFQTKQTRLGVNGGAVAEVFEIKEGANNGDKLYLGVLDAGVVITDVKLTFDAGGANTTLALGYEPYGHTDFAASANYFLPATASVNAGAARSNAHSIEFSNRVALVAVVGGGNLVGTPLIKAVVTGNGVGYK